MTAVGVRDKQGAVQNFFLLHFSPLPGLVASVAQCATSTRAAQAGREKHPVHVPLTMCSHRPPLPPLLLKMRTPSIFSLLTENQLLPLSCNRPVNTPNPPPFFSSQAHLSLIVFMPLAVLSLDSVSPGSGFWCH